MNCARMHRRRLRRRAGGPLPSWHPGPFLLLLVAAGFARTVPAAAQPTTGTVPTGAPTGAAATGLAPTGLAPSGLAPSILPPPPIGPFGLPNPLTPPNALPNGITPAASQQPAYSLALPSPGAGITTLQQYDPNAPAILIQPTLSLGETLTDNVFYSSTDRTAAAETRLIPGVTVSADTPRLQGVMTAQVEGDAYIPTSTLDQLFANLYANGTVTILPEHLFVDLQSSISQASTLPGLGFLNASQLPRTQQTQIFANTISPYLRESFDGKVDTELRYRFGSTNFGGGDTLTTSPTLTPANTSLASGTLNEGTFTAGTGRDFQRAQSRLTIDASSFNSSSENRNTQLSGFDDLQYQITPDIAALGRIGYQTIQYPLAPAASFVGPTWLVGGRLGLGGNYGYVSLEYGVQQGVYGFTGSALYQLTPTITVTADLVQGISSPAEFLQTSLASSTLSPYGGIVDQSTGLPTSFYLPGAGFTNGVYRQHLFNAQISDTIGRNSYGLYGYYSSQAPLTPPITAPTTSVGASLSWSRDIRPDLNGYTSIGYANTANAVSPTTLASVSSINTVTANIGVNYQLSRNLTGSVLYTFTYEPNGGAVVSGRSGDVLVNTLQLLLTKAF
jgi:uncharacterized protein (PEP-CTERM system associated)